MVVKHRNVYYETSVGFGGGNGGYWKALEGTRGYYGALRDSQTSEVRGGWAETEM